jgi:tRNA threonylcarbamoyladenosine biosynthesis protein TsaB
VAKQQGKEVPFMSTREPRLLIVETSGRVGHVALAEGATLLRGRRLDEARRHARDLAPAAADLLAGQGWRPADLDAVVVSRGPGSYTGLRVGVMSAKALAYATGCALLGVDTFAAIALQAPRDAVRVDVLADAQQDKVYAQRFERPGAGAAAVPLSPLAIERFDDWLARQSESAWVSGPALRVYATRLPADCPVASADLWDPRPESLLRLGLARYLAGERDDVWTLEPIYLRPSSAEEKWQDRNPSGAR